MHIFKVRLRSIHSIVCLLTFVHLADGIKEGGRETVAGAILVELPFCEPGNGWSFKFFAESYIL